MPSPSPFAPLTPEQLEADRLRRAAAEAEIARKEAALAEAEARLKSSQAAETDMEAELETLRTASAGAPPTGQTN
jgi:hypothetical protein